MRSNLFFCVTASQNIFLHSLRSSRWSRCRKWFWSLLGLSLCLNILKCFTCVYVPCLCTYEYRCQPKGVRPPKLVVVRHLPWCQELNLGFLQVQEALFNCQLSSTMCQGLVWEFAILCTLGKCTSTLSCVPRRHYVTQAGPELANLPASAIYVGGWAHATIPSDALNLLIID